LIVGMRRRRKKNPFDLILPFVGLVVLGFVFSPVLRGVIIALLCLAAAVLMILIILAVYRHCQKKQDLAHDAFYLGRKDPSKDNASGTAKGSLANAESEVEAASQPSASVDSGLLRVRVKGEAYVGAKLPERFTVFSRELLDALEWRRFEQLVTWYFQKTGFEAMRSRVGADGGVDIHLAKKGETTPFAYVQCKAWYAYKVGVKPIRELFGVMAADGIGTGYFVTTGDFTVEAQQFALGKGMKLVSGAYLLERLGSLPEPHRSELLREATLGDYTTPTCPRCDEKMVLRSGPDGEFWGCRYFSRRPSCRQTFKLRTASPKG